MAINDKILLDGIIDDRIRRGIPSDRRDEVFEYLAYEQILKDKDLSSEEIDNCSVDGRDDGGIDGFFIFVNGHLLVDPESFIWPKAGAEIEVWIINCKHHDTFQQAPLDKLNASFVELLDFSLDKNNLKGDYSEEVLSKRTNLMLAYRKLSPRLNNFTLHFAYASRGDTDSIGESITSRADQLVALAKNSFSDCTSDFQFVGSAELVGLHRRKPIFTLELPFIEVLSRGQNYILLAKLDDYYNFVADNGKLRRYLFDSNVRDFMGLNRVNEDIQETLRNTNSQDFWWLNNGVTILVSAASVIGKIIKMSDIQIVNGLQSTESIYRHYNHGLGDPNGRAILVKVLVSNNDTDRDAIIRSTNNQTLVELASLHATDKIQRDIEEVLEREGLYYERRKNFYSNLGHRSADIVTPLYMAAGFVALVLKNPQRAVGLRARFMRVPASYEAIFSDNTPITLWPTIGHILKRVDEALEIYRPGKCSLASGENYLKGWRYISAFCIVARHFGTFDYTRAQFGSLVATQINSTHMQEIIDTLWHARERHATNKQWVKSYVVEQGCKSVADKFGTNGLAEWLAHGRRQIVEAPWKRKHADVAITDEFVEKVNGLLPEQPWKPGIEKAIIETLGCSRDEYFAATNKLIEDGTRYRQHNGVVYDSEGNVLCFDKDRVDPDTMSLIE